MRRSSASTTAPSKSFNDRLILVTVLLLALIGLGVGVKLSEVHYETHTDPQYKSVCAVNEEVNCETVARSPYSVFLGAPVSAWAIWGYLLIAFFAIWGSIFKPLHPSWPLGVLTLLIAAAALSASILAYISFTLIDSVCLFCMTLYLINLALVVLVVVHATRRRIHLLGAVISDIRSLISRPIVSLLLFLVIGGVTVAMPLLVPPYWHHPGWQELPSLPTGVDKRGHDWIGAMKPRVTIDEFSDYQCPYCRRAHKNMRLLAARYPDEVRLVHRHLPLDQSCNNDVKHPFHNRACTFARATVCAGLQNQFWAMNDAIFSIQDEIRPDDVDVEALAVQLGLDRSQFKECMGKQEVPPNIRRDLAASRELGIRGTPTFLLDGQPYEGGIPERALEVRVENARKR